MWRTPTFKEVAVGLEINCYACAEIQRMDKSSRDKLHAAAMGLKIPNYKTMPLNKLAKLIPVKLRTELGIKVIDEKMMGGMVKKKMMGGKIKKTYAMGGGIRKANYK